MIKVGAFEAKNSLGALLDRVERGEEILITRHGKPVARLVGPAQPAKFDQAIEAAQRLRTRAQALNVRFDWEDLKRDRDEGRRRAS